MALGLRELNETPFVESTIFNFGNRLAAWQARTGQNLLERVFDRLTGQQLQALHLKTNIQRADSFLAASNIRDYSRLQLIIEVLQRFCRVLGGIYQQLLQDFEADYGDTQAWGILQRVYTEHFTTCGQTVGVRPAEQLDSDCLQSPDDPDITRKILK